IAERDKLLQQCQLELDALQDQLGEHAVVAMTDAQPVNITYPVLEYPSKVVSLNFDKTPEVAGTLLGIKGQYLLLDSGVINIRKFTGYQVEVAV
ncbi:MAG TPA: DUF2797 domain-containing protein, partial [Gammaproteobacteria bacterium]|nr:DUF2797 domain-containing protein [Gammaproteobacteria bacterium]